VPSIPGIRMSLSTSWIGSGDARATSSADSSGTSSVAPWSCASSGAANPGPFRSARSNSPPRVAGSRPPYLSFSRSTGRRGRPASGAVVRGARIAPGRGAPLERLPQADGQPLGAAPGTPHGPTNATDANDCRPAAHPDPVHRSSDAARRRCFISRGRGSKDRIPRTASAAPWHRGNFPSPTRLGSIVASPRGCMRSRETLVFHASGRAGGAVSRERIRDARWTVQAAHRRACFGSWPE